MNKKKFFITTPIFYLNGSPHLGHAYTLIISDIIARYKKSKGYDVFFQTGTDDHGEKMLKKANSLNISPFKLANNNSLIFKELWERLGISQHIFFRTSDDSHKEKVKEIFFNFLEKDEIYLDNYDGDYCLVCEEYVIPPRDDEKSKKCPNCFSTIERIREKSFFLKVKKHQQFLFDYYEKHQQFLLPIKVKKEIINSFLRDDIRDLCITRDNLDWGIKVNHGKNNLTIYVWFDALCNYINSEEGKMFFSSTDNKDLEIVQIIGKDISRFHGIYWLIILKLLGMRFPDKILAHGWIINNDEKMSKSKNNVIDPMIFLNKFNFSKDLMRIYSVGKIKFLEDGEMDEEKLITFYENFFVNDLGNLISRVLSMSLDLNDSKIPFFSEIEAKMNFDLNKYREICIKCTSNFINKMDNYDLTGGFLEIERIIDESNKLIQKLSPWKIENNYILKKNIMNFLLNGIKIISFLLEPIIPESSKNIARYFNIELEKINWDNLFDFNYISGSKLEKRNHLFPRIKK